MITQHATGCAHATRAIESKNVSVATNVTVVVCELTIIERTAPRERDVHANQTRGGDRESVYVYENEKGWRRMCKRERQARVFERKQDKEVILCYRGVHSRSTAFTAVRGGRYDMTVGQKNRRNPRTRRDNVHSPHCPRTVERVYVHMFISLGSSRSCDVGRARLRPPPAVALSRPLELSQQYYCTYTICILFIALVNNNNMYICSTDSMISLRGKKRRISNLNETSTRRHI